MPLEPPRKEACRSCQPMHVLSFGEGRSGGLLGLHPFRLLKYVWGMNHSPLQLALNCEYDFVCV